MSWMFFIWAPPLASSQASCFLSKQHPQGLHFALSAALGIISLLQISLSQEGRARPLSMARTCHNPALSWFIKFISSLPVTSFFRVSGLFLFCFVYLFHAPHISQALLVINLHSHFGLSSSSPETTGSHKCLSKHSGSYCHSRLKWTTDLIC